MTYPCGRCCLPVSEGLADRVGHQNAGSLSNQDLRTDAKAISTPDIDRRLLDRTDAPDRLFGDSRNQQLLNFRRGVFKLIKENGSTRGRFEKTNLGAVSARKCALTLSSPS
jgi:hypothetical protein